MLASPTQTAGCPSREGVARSLIMLLMAWSQRGPYQRQQRTEVPLSAHEEPSQRLEDDSDRPLAISGSVAGSAPTRHPVWVAAFLDRDRSPRHILLLVLLHGVGFAVGLVLAWVVVGELWVRFDGIVPMWVGSTVMASAAVALIAWRRARFAGIGAGLILSALLASTIFTFLSSGPALD